MMTPPTQAQDTQPQQQAPKAGAIPGLAPMTPPSLPSGSPLTTTGGAPGSATANLALTPPRSPATSPIPSGAPQMPAAPSVAPAAPQTPPPVTGAMQSFGPGSDLRTTQINPTADPRLAATQQQVSASADKLANGPDRFQLAQDRFKTYSDQTDPAFQASIRSATQHAAANGAIGSGMLGTTYGDLGLQRTRDLTNERDNLFNNALEGTIGDTRANTSLLSGLEGQQYGENANNQNALRGERAYQNGMEQQAYDRGVQGLTLEDQLTNSAFNRGVTQQELGMQNNPAQMQMLLSGLYGQQASNAGNALSGMIRDTTANNAVRGAYGQPTSDAPPTPIDLSGIQMPNVQAPNIDSILGSIYGGR